MTQVLATAAVAADAGRAASAELPTAVPAENPSSASPESPTGATSPGRQGAAESRKHLRGSSMLLGGRVIALGLNFAVSVLLVRALAKAEFGAFSYALAMASLAAVIAGGGLDKAIGRFVPIYHERNDHSRMLGAVLLAVGAILGVGLGLALFVWTALGTIAGHWVSDPASASLLAILILLAPLEALDRLLAQLIAVFARPRAIFWRKHVLGPALKLTAVLLMLQLHSGVRFLAFAYLTASAIGTLLYLYMLLTIFREHQLWGPLRSRSVSLPARELFGYSVPLLSSDAVLVLRSSFAVFLLEFLHSSTSVAEFRAVLPVARLNFVVAESFLLLFLPLASRMFARGEHQAVGGVYWQTATWITLLTFPVFAVTFVLSEPVTVLLFGAEYAGAGRVLAILAVGSYVNAALGFNAAMLRVYGKVRWIVTIDIAVAAIALPIAWLLIDRYGALGAAMAVTLTHVLHNLLNQAALLRLVEGREVPVDYLRVGATVVAVLIGMYAVQATLAPPLPVMIVIVAVGCILVLLANRRALDLGDTFPELRRVPVLGRLCGSAA